MDNQSYNCLWMNHKFKHLNRSDAEHTTPPNVSPVTKQLQLGQRLPFLQLSEKHVGKKLKSVQDLSWNSVTKGAVTKQEHWSNWFWVHKGPGPDNPVLNAFAACFHPPLCFGCTLTELWLLMSLPDVTSFEWKVQLTLQTNRFQNSQIDTLVVQWHSALHASDELLRECIYSEMQMPEYTIPFLLQAPSH